MFFLTGFPTTAGWLIRKGQEVNICLEVHFTRYVVPGRFDIYSFRLVLTERCYRLQYFSDCDIPISKAVRQFKTDLKKKKVQELIKLARQNKFCDRVIPQLLHYFRKDKLL